MIFRIDGVQLSCAPASVDVIPAGAAESKMGGGNRLYIEDLSGVDVEAVFGDGALSAIGLRELETARGTQGLHLITFENIDCDELVDLLVYMPKVPHTRMRGIADGNYAYAETTLTFHQVTPPTQLVQFHWWFYESAGYSVADNKFLITMLGSGRFVDLTGYWFSIIGAGGEEIHAQLRNVTQASLDYLSTEAKFKVNTGTGQMEDAVFIANPDFVKGDVIALDIDQITSGAPPAGSSILVLQGLAAIY